MRLVASALMLVAILGCISLASAGEAALGGYTYGASGYWWKNGSAYYRTKVYLPVTYYYDSYGQSYSNPQQYYYRYTLVAPVAQVPAYTPDWRTQLNDYATRKLDYDAYLKTLQTMGVGANHYGVPGYSGSGYFGATFSTQYGYPAQPYSVSQVASFYGQTDVNAQLTAASRLAKNAQDLAGTSTQDFQNAVNRLVDGNNSAARILAAGLAVERAAAGSASATTGGGQRGPALENIPLPQGISAQAAEFLKTIGVPRCGACHTGATPKGNFNILLYPGMTAEQKDAVMATLVGGDDGKHTMPRKLDGGVGLRLPAKEVREFGRN